MNKVIVHAEDGEAIDLSNLPELDRCLSDAEKSPSQFSSSLALWAATCSHVVYCSNAQLDVIATQLWGSESFEFFECSKTDTQAFAMALGSCVLLAFRGTSSLRDWQTNVNYTLTFPFSHRDESNENTSTSKSVQVDGKRRIGVHRGFWQALDSIFERVALFVKAHAANGKRVVLCGHSLGGALATLASARLVLQERVRVDVLFTFGQPRAGNRSLGDALDDAAGHMLGSYWRVVNNRDVVPHTGKGCHCGRRVLIDAGGRFLPGSNGRRWRSAPIANLKIVSLSDHLSGVYRRLALAWHGRCAMAQASGLGGLFVLVSALMTMSDELCRLASLTRRRQTAALVRTNAANWSLMRERLCKLYDTSASIISKAADHKALFERLRALFERGRKLEGVLRKLVDAKGVMDGGGVSLRRIKQALRRADSELRASCLIVDRFIGQQQRSALHGGGGGSMHVADSQRILRQPAQRQLTQQNYTNGASSSSSSLSSVDARQLARSEPLHSPPQQQRQQSDTRLVARWRYANEDDAPGVLSFEKGDIVTLICQRTRQWAEGVLDGVEHRRGLFPIEYFEPARRLGGAMRRRFARRRANQLAGTSSVAAATTDAATKTAISAHRTFDGGGGGARRVRARSQPPAPRLSSSAAAATTTSNDDSDDDNKSSALLLLESALSDLVELVEEANAMPMNVVAALHKLDAQLMQQQRKREHHLELALAYALVGQLQCASDADAAMSLLERAVALGYCDERRLSRSPHFATVRSTPRFAAIVDGTSANRRARFAYERVLAPRQIDELVALYNERAAAEANSNVLSRQATQSTLAFVGDTFADEHQTSSSLSSSSSSSSSSPSFDSMSIVSSGVDVDAFLNLVAERYRAIVK
jgi:triacylglycerol lipase